MVYDHYLDHQPKRDTNIASWILLAILVSFFVGFFAHSAIGEPPPVHSFGAGPPTQNALPMDARLDLPEAAA
jgi:hypothetical protein